MRSLIVAGFVGGLFGGFAAGHACAQTGTMPFTPSATPSHVLTQEGRTINGYIPTWWKEAVVYEVYPRSFQDSNGDGIGDLRGVTSRLDYLQRLGVNVVWLGPHYDSPNADNGYDIRDYRKIMAEFGTMADFDELLAGIKKRHMRLILDLVVNHTSDENSWFVESRKSKDNPYRDFYFWRPGKPGENGTPPPPNNFPSFFSGSAWKLDPATNEYYLHLFAEKQPDLNWDNPKVRADVYSIMKFWLDKGVDGFRMDVIPFISKNPAFPDLKRGESSSDVYASGPHLHEYIQEMNRNVLSQYDTLTVGEALGISLQKTPLLVDERRKELNMIFNFDIVHLERDGRKIRPWTLPELKALYARQTAGLDAHSWNTIFLSNHDNPRVVSTFGDDSPEWRAPSAKVLATLLLTQRGTPFLYQGDELGMTNYPFQKIDQLRDIEAKNAWKADVLSGKETAAQYMDDMRHTSRDNSRTPMQWNGSRNGGFTTAEVPWIAVNPNYGTINAEQQLKDPNSVYEYFRGLIALRASTPALIYGDYQDLDPENPKIFSYTRSLGEDKYLVLMNFSREPVDYALPTTLKVGELVLSSDNRRESGKATVRMAGWEARVYRVR
ncbi:alpha,alpha-phosphotrehalase [Granulicella sp. S156]|uniref:alpha,alpha-phosphotrehalase n=1 Tax=Granulicella sp. S156 TaxID=1747224 RepID=UPI0020B1706D|nr:alpha,alpha-phosphotrehalase [Granulicella sp. S156]